MRSSLFVSALAITLGNLKILPSYIFKMEFGSILIILFIVFLLMDLGDFIIRWRKHK